MKYTGFFHTAQNEAFLRNTGSVLPYLAGDSQSAFVACAVIPVNGGFLTYSGV